MKKEVFQFPSNGKAYLNFFKTNDNYEDKLFQFPSNGKAYLNHSHFFLRGEITLVSIPFKRESISEQSGARHHPQCQ